MGNVRLIITKNRVYTTHYKTIVFDSKIKYVDDFLTDESHDAIKEAKAIAFDYACYYSRPNVRILDVNEDWKSIDVFNYLDKLDKKETY